jgi:hypothetical protein
VHDILWGSSNHAPSEAFTELILISKGLKRILKNWGLRVCFSSGTTSLILEEMQEVLGSANCVLPFTTYWVLDKTQTTYKTSCPTTFVYNVRWPLKIGIVEREETSAARRKLGEHASTVTNTHGPLMKHRVQQFFYCVCTLCLGNEFTELLPNFLCFENEKERVKSIIFWDMTPCSQLSFDRRFGGTYRLHLQRRNNRFSEPVTK